MKLSAEIQKEIEEINSSKFCLGEYIYMGMGLVGMHRVCISVAYKIDYCIKKAQQFVQADSNIVFTHINKVKVGETQPCKQFEVKNI